WAGSIGDRHEGPQVADQMHRTAFIGPRRIAMANPQITISKLDCSDLFASKRLRAGNSSQPAAWGASIVRVLVASAFLGALCREVCRTAGENVTATKHRFEFWSRRCHAGPAAVRDP